MNQKIKILIADDHAVVRAGLTTLLSTEDDIVVVAQAKNGNEAISKVLETRPDVVIMDLRMPAKDGADATAEIHRRHPATKILILTSFGEADGVAHALECGASGAITKTAEDAELLSVVRKVAAGERFISPEIKKMLKDNPPVPKLTPRQLEILSYMVRGLTNRDIAESLKISTDTVEEHVNLILAKLNAANRAEAVAIALKKHLLKIWPRAISQLQRHLAHAVGNVDRRGGSDRKYEVFRPPFRDLRVEHGDAVEIDCLA